MESLRLLSVHCQAETAAHVELTALHCGVVLRMGQNARNVEDAVDDGMVDPLTAFALKSKLSLPEFIRVVRGQTADDPRPNKDLYELPRPPAPALRQHWSQWNHIVGHGVIPEWLPEKPARQAHRPPNHASLHEHLPQVCKHLRAGQRDGRYLIVRPSLLAQWPEVLSLRLVLSRRTLPTSGSLTIILFDFTDRTNFPEVSYNPPRDITKRIWTRRQEHPDARILLMLGDVSGAFRHVPIHEDHAHMFAFMVGDFLVIDMACGFGWCGSPAMYFIPVALINGLYEDSSTTTTIISGSDAGSSLTLDAGVISKRAGSFWCDDHTCLEIDSGIRCFLANLALRRAMLTVLGPGAVNERKFTSWNERGRALGLDWDTVSCTVAIPPDKLLKAVNAVRELLASPVATKTKLLSLIGRLRHIASCCPPTRAFYQRLQATASRTSRFGRHFLDSAAMEDLTVKWFLTIVAPPSLFNKISVGNFAGIANPTVHVAMNASNDGLCACEPRLSQFIRINFTSEAKAAMSADPSANSINARELQSAVLAALLWGPSWAKLATDRPVSVCFWIDNRSTVSWARRRTSQQPLAQLYNRLLSLAEVNYSLACTAEHVPGVENIMADAGSRAWSAEHALYPTWTNLSRGWSQVSVGPPFDDLSQLWQTYYATAPSWILPQPSASLIGVNGANYPP